MRKQIVNLLTVAMLALTVGTIFSSCKDYDDEMYADLNGQIVDVNSNLTTLLDAQAKDLEDLKSALEAAKSDCAAKYNATQTSLKNKQDSIDALDAKIKALEADAQNHATKAELAAAKTELNAKIDALEDVVDDLKTQMATKQQLDDAIAAVNQSIEAGDTKLNTRIDSVIAAIKDNVVTMSSALTTLQTATTNLAKADEDIKDSIESIQSKMAEAQTYFTNEITKVATAAQNAATQAAANKTAIETLTNVVNNIKQCTDCDALKERCAALEAKVDSIDDEIVAIKEQADANLAEAKKYTDDAVKIVADELVTVNATIAKMESAYKLADMKLDGKIKKLEKSLNTLDKQVKKNTKAIDELVDSMDDVKDALNKRISSVVLQGAYSPVVGYFAMPTGMKSNILATYYGIPKSDVNFPTASTVRYVDGIVAFDERVMELLGFDDNDGSFPAGVSYPANKPLVADTANAGKLYMTINPNDVDLSETSFKLVNSLGEESTAILGEVKKSSEKLSFGYTRAGANNGFYEVSANITPENVENATIRINKSDIKDIVSEFKNFSDGINIANVTTKFYTIINDVADANAIEATWTDSLGEHSVYSDYGIAAVAVEPLSYNFMADVNMTSFPGINRVSNFVNNLMDKINVTVPTFDVDGIKASIPVIEQIEIQELSPELVGKFLIKTTITYNFSEAIAGDTIVIEQKTYTASDGITTVTIPADTIIVEGKDITKEISIPFEYDMRQAVKDLYNQTTGSIKDVNEMLADLDGFMDKLNDLLAELDKINDVQGSIDDAKDKVKTQLNKYIDKLNNKLCGLVNSVNGKMQPTMLVKTNGDFSILSTIKSNPSELNAASAVLVPTSFNAEILAPAFKKYVAVSNVIDAATGKNAYDGDATCVNVLKAANSGDLNKVLEGSTRTIEFNGQSGYIYEITYSAVDYDGFISNSKYYITIK